MTMADRELVAGFHELMLDEPPLPNFVGPAIRDGKRLRNRRRTALGAACLAGVVVVGGPLFTSVHRHGASGPAAVGSGVVTGQVPLCYGPGPNLNLTPTVTVTALQNGRVVRATSVKDTSEQHTYKLELPAGDYQIHAGQWPAHRVVVEAGSTSHVDLPGGGCL
jgi:hypothetical protein